jgi:DNA-binding response OmpR family regulator
MNDRILIIDDEKHIRRMMRLTLEAAGYEVDEAQDGTEGLNLFGDGSHWSLVVLDQRMPGMDGLETLRELKKQNASARVVMATAYASIELAIDAMKLGASDFVRKPMTPEVLRNSVAAALSKSPVDTGAPGLAPSAPAPSSVPSIQTITMNGFTILDDTDTPKLDECERRFVVVSPDGDRHDVLVEIQSELVEYVTRMTGRRLAPDNSFWTSQARRLLSDFLWTESKVPPMHRLVLKDLDPDKLSSAARWKS